MDNTTDDYDMRFCLGELTQAERDELATYLQNEGALPDAVEAKARAAHTAAVVRDENGVLIAQLALEPRYVEQLDNRFWVVTAYVSREHRHSALSRQMNVFVCNNMEQRFLAGDSPDIIGLFMVVQTRSFKNLRNDAVTPHGFVFIGRNERGDNMRVYYFRGANIDGSPPELERAPERSELGEGYRLEVVRDQLDGEFMQLVAEFLQREGALKNPDQAQLRATQTVAVAYDGQGNLAAVHSAERRYLPQLLNEFWAISVFVGKQHRRFHLARHLNLVGKEYLLRQYAAGNDPMVVGLYMRMQSPRLKPADQRAVAYYSGYYFVGRNARGDNLRIFYFPGVKIDAGSLDISGAD